MVVPPDEDSIARGAKYSSHIDPRDAWYGGVVRDAAGEIRWRYAVRKSKRHGDWKSTLYSKRFTMTDTNTGEEFVIRRRSLFPPRFAIFDSQREFGAMRLASILRNRYIIELGGQKRWTFTMPLFSVRFFGGTGESPEFWVSVGPSKADWNILIKPGNDAQPLLAALSFIHYRYWYYT